MRASALLVALSLAVSSCSKPPPPKEPEPPPPPPPVKEEPPPPPPPPKCESLSEKCAGSADSRATITSTGASFHPPPGWLYAKEEKVTIAQSTGEDGFVVFAGADADGPDAVLPVVTHLAERLGLSDVKTQSLKTRWKKPQSTLDAGGTPVRLWEVAKEYQGVDPKLKDKPGAALVVVATVGGKVIVGLCFVPKSNDAANVPLMMDAVKSLRSGT